MSSTVARCIRCGIERTVHTRKSTGLCRDCLEVDPKFGQTSENRVIH